MVYLRGEDVNEEMERVEELYRRAAFDETARADALATLTHLADQGTTSEVRKAARRALHRLASRGVRPAAAEKISSPSATSSREVYQALASPIDGAGNRGIWFGFRRGADVDLAALLLSDDEGIKDIVVREVSLSRFDREASRVLEDEHFPWIEMPADYGRHLVNLAHRQNAVSGVSLPLEYLAWRDQISRPLETYEKPIVYTVLNAAEVRWDPRNLDNSASLYNLELFRGWIFDKEELAEFVRERLSAERSGLVLAGAAGEERDELIEDRAIQALFDARRRALYKGRLEEMSYLLWRLGRLEAARSALAAALAMEPADRPLLNHPFIQEMVRVSLAVVTEMAREDRTREIRPGLQLHLP